PELQPRAFRPYISPSASAPSFPTSSSYSGNRSPSPSSSSPYYAGAGGGSGGGDRQTGSSMKNPRLSSSTFAHNNVRIAVALVPSAAFLLDLGGAPVISALVVGLMVAYVLDSLSFKFGSFFAVWFSLIAAQITFFFSSSLLYSLSHVSLGIFAMLTCALANFLIGVWVSLQFKWMQMEYPTIVLTLERLLFACVPLVASAIFTWATISAVGMTNAAYYFMVFNCIFYWLYSIPRVSSFRLKQEVNYHGSQSTEDLYILGQLESCVHTLNLLFFPLVFHIASHYLVIFSSSSSVCDLLLLFFIPFLFQLYASTRGALWWVTKSENQLRSIQFVNGAIALAVVVVSLEVRVVFHSFGRYIQVPPPLNYALVTVTMLGTAAAAGAYAVGLVSDASSSLVFTALAMVASAAGAIVVGLPILFLPVPLAAGYHLSRFFTKKSLFSYFIFTVLASFMVAWFVIHNYWDLNIWIAGMSLKSFSKLIVASVILAMAIPGVAVLPPKFRFLTEAGLISHALLLCYVENSLFNYSNFYYYGIDEDVMYPSYMVVFTSLAGLAIVRRLSLDLRIGSKAVWVLICLYSAKLSLLFVASKAVLWVSALLLLAVSPPLLLYKDKSKAVSKMKPWQGYAHAAVIAFSIWYCRDTIFEALQWWNGRPPSDGFVLGACIFLAGLACIPIVTLHFPNAM
ncbi:hypothetical protein M569_12112, partial [Genlisea aurea]